MMKNNSVASFNKDSILLSSTNLCFLLSLKSSTERVMQLARDLLFVLDLTYLLSDFIYSRYYRFWHFSFLA